MSWRRARVSAGAGSRCASAGVIQGGRGVGLIECLIALLLTSTALVALLATQLAGKRAAYEALQRSTAVALARDIVVRVQANRDHAAAYTIRGAGDVDNPLPFPAHDCSQVDCDPMQLAAYDLWEWELLLLGAAEQYRGGGAGGLVAPSACVLIDGQLVTVTLLWRGHSPTAAGTESDCSRAEGLYDEPGHAPGNGLLRRALVLTADLGAAGV